MKKKLLSLALALVMCLGLTVPAFAADWDNAKEVKNFEEFLDAVLDEKVEEIKIVGEVTIPKPVEYPLTVETPTLIAKEGKLTMAPEGVLFVHVPMGQFIFEDQENTWDHVAEMCETFIIWHPDEESYNRDIFGTQPDINELITSDDEPINCLVVSGGDVTLTEDLSVESALRVHGHNLTVGKGVKLEVGFLYVDGDLTLEEGASLTVTGEEGGVVTGKITAADEKQIPENVKASKAPAEDKKDEKPAEDKKDEAPAAPKFADVAPTSPFAKAIDWAVEQKITTGKTETTFGPSDTCTVSHILTFLWRANGKPGAAEGVKDRDAAAKWAVEQKLIAEDQNLDAACTRAMAVTFMWKVAGSPEADASKLAFTDFAAEDSFAPAIAWAVENKVTTGTSETTFSPDNTCTRGQIVTFLFRASQAAAPAEGEASK